MLKTGILVLLTICSLGFASESSADAVYASRTIEDGTDVLLIINNTVIPAILNDSKTSKALIAKLPYSANLQRYSHGYCGAIRDSLPVDNRSLHSGWLNGDIVYAQDSNELAILYKDEDISHKLYDGLVTLGTISAPLATMETLDRSISIRIERP